MLHGLDQGEQHSALLIRQFGDPLTPLEAVSSTRSFLLRIIASLFSSKVFSVCQWPLVLTHLWPINLTHPAIVLERFHQDTALLA